MYMWRQRVCRVIDPRNIKILSGAVIVRQNESFDIHRITALTIAQKRTKCNKLGIKCMEISNKVFYDIQKNREW